MDPESDPLGKGFQIISRNWRSEAEDSGSRLHGGKQKLFYLPEAHTDFIFAVIGEEIGLMELCWSSACSWSFCGEVCEPPFVPGSLRILPRIRHHDDDRGASLHQYVWCSGSCRRRHPVAFLSYGGSSFIVMLASVGILLNISQQAS
jgi:cell division protein FtsW